MDTIFDFNLELPSWLPVLVFSLVLAFVMFRQTYLLGKNIRLARMWQAMFYISVLMAAQEVSEERRAQTHDMLLEYKRIVNKAIRDNLVQAPHGWVDGDSVYMPEMLDD